MTLILPPRPTEWRDAKSPPQRPPVDDSNEFAAFAAQLAARNEKRRAGEASAAPPPGVDQDEDREEAASHSLSSRLAWRPVAAMAGGVLLLVMVSVAVLALRDRPFQVPTPLSSNRIEPAKADSSAAGKRDVTVPSSVPASPASAANGGLASAGTASSCDLCPGGDRSLAGQPAAGRERTCQGDPESPPPSASQIPSASEPGSAPLTPDEIRELQGKLKAAGFNPGAIDGIVGPQTRGALRTDAQSRSLQNADATRDLLVRLNAEPTPATAGTGARGIVAGVTKRGEQQLPGGPGGGKARATKTTCTADVGPFPPTEPTRPKPSRFSCAISAFLMAPPKGRSVR